MTQKLSLNTQAILLLTAPLLLSKNSVSSDLLTNADYKMVVRHLLDLGKKPADLLSTNANQLLDDCNPIIDKSRMERLLARGFLLGQVVEYWKERSIWVVSRADENYPSRLKSQLKENAPPVIYGCGNMKLLETGGLAVVGSRNVNDDLIEYSKEIGRLAARSKITIVSGGAKGVDISSMQGALEEGGNACGFLSDSLEKAALTRTNREPLMNNQLVLITANDPRDNFTVGFAMQRNKYIYALADASLIVNSDLEKGGTWAGAQEQLEKFHMVPVYVRSTGERSPGIDGLIKKGAMLWPNPNTPSDFTALVNKTGVNKDFRMTVKVEGKT
ncbi:MAG: DNA-processing protein DprA, partial [Planctomycetota bacterium]